MCKRQFEFQFIIGFGPIQISVAMDSSFEVDVVADDEGERDMTNIRSDMINIMRGLRS